MKTLRVLVCTGLMSLALTPVAQAANSSWLKVPPTHSAAACSLSLKINSCAATALPPDPNLAANLQLAPPQDPEMGCSPVDCVADTSLPAMDSTSSENSSTQTTSNPDMTQGPSDRTGYYMLGAIPLIVGVGSLIGLDHRLPYDGTGIWKRSRQLDLEYAVALTEIGGSLWLGGQSRIGRTFWQSLDASAFSALTVQALKYTFSRARPYQSDSPNHWFQGGCCQSFPSGEVTLQASFVTPFIIEYQHQDPWVWGLEALPLYDALARMKTQGHWQTDVLSGWVLGTAFGIFAHNRKMPFFLGLMPHGVMVGWHTSF